MRKNALFDGENDETTGLITKYLSFKNILFLAFSSKHQTRMIFIKNFPSFATIQDQNFLNAFIF